MLTTLAAAALLGPAWGQRVAPPGSAPEAPAALQTQQAPASQQPGLAPHKVRSAAAPAPRPAPAQETANPPLRPRSRLHSQLGALPHASAAASSDAPQPKTTAIGSDNVVPDAGTGSSQKELVDGLQGDEIALGSELVQIRQQDIFGRKTLIVLGIVLAILILLAIALVITFWLKARAWNRRLRELVEQAEAAAARLSTFEEARNQARVRLPALLEQIGDQPLSFDEEGRAFSDKAVALLDEVDALAYRADPQAIFSDLSNPADAAVYLNGLLLSAAARLSPVEARPGWNEPEITASGSGDLWIALTRLNRFLDLLSRAPRSVGSHRVAQAFSYRALAGYRILETQAARPSWQRRSERANNLEISRQAFADIAEAARIDPEWRHTLFVEALLSSRFFSLGDPANGSRAELEARGLKRAAELLKQLIDLHSYRGPARRQLARCAKWAAEHSGEKSDFSDFGYLISSFPSDEELADEALAARRPDSQDRFLWQWMLSDSELFGSLERLNPAEYRSFWIQLLDSKVHLRNWRADLAELERKNPAMRAWPVQLLHGANPIPLASIPGRRQEYLETPFSGD